MNELTLAYLLIAFGVACLLAELFLPTGGIMFMISAILVIIGCIIAVVYGDTETAFITLGLVFIGCPALLVGVFYFWPTAMMGKKLIPNEEEMATQATINAPLDKLKGRIGKTISTLRPAGIAEFEGRRVDCISEGVMIDAGRYVRCIDVKAGRVIVRVMEENRLDDLENANFG